MILTGISGSISKFFLNICETSKPLLKTEFRTEFSRSQNPEIDEKIGSDLDKKLLSGKNASRQRFLPFIGDWILLNYPKTLIKPLKISD